MYLSYLHPIFDWQYNKREIWIVDKKAKLSSIKYYLQLQYLDYLSGTKGSDKNNLKLRFHKIQIKKTLLQQQQKL